MLLAANGFDYQTSVTPWTDMAFDSVNYAASVGGSKSATTPYGVGSSVTATGAFQNFRYTYSVGAVATIVTGIKLRVPTSIGSTAYDFCRLLDAGSVQVGLGITTGGKLFLYRNTSATVIETGTTTMFADTWYMIELKVTIGNSAAYEARIDEVTELSGTADTQQTANATTDALLYGHLVSSGSSGFFDDFYCCDTTGGVANNFLGNIRVETKFVTSDDAVQFTPLSSTNASNVDETNSDGDTTYNSSSTAGHVDTFNHAALSTTPSAIYGVSVVAKIRKDDTTSRNARTKFKSSATTSNGTTTAMATSFKYLETLYTTDPNTAVAWAASGVNATKIGYELVS